MLKGFLDCVYPDKDARADVEVLVHKGLGGRGARLHRLKILHSVFEGAGEVLDTGGLGMGVLVRISADSLCVVL